MRDQDSTMRRAYVAVQLVLMLSALAGWQILALADGAAIQLGGDAGWTLDAAALHGRAPTQTGSMEIRGVGELTFDPSAISVLRSDVFLPGHFSIFDVLVHLSDTHGLELEYAFDESQQTYVIHSMRGLTGWWYDAHYEGGSFDKTVVRMDQFPVKDGMSIILYLEDPARLDAITEHYREEVTRLTANEGEIIVPSVVLQSSTLMTEFTDVTVTAHEARSDVFQPGTITMIDILLSLGEQGHLTELGIDWRDSDGDVAVVDGAYVVSIQSDEFSPAATGSCVLTHQIQGETIADYLSPHTHTMSHIHLTADLEVLVAPESVEWLWICL